MSEKVDLDELIKGIKVEEEHGPDGPAEGKFDITDGDPVETAEIAAAHLSEMPDYYTELDKMENKTAGITSDLYGAIVGSPWRKSIEPRNIEMLSRYLGAGAGGLLGGAAIAGTGGLAALPALAASAGAVGIGAGLGSRISGAGTALNQKILEILGMAGKEMEAVPSLLGGKTWRNPETSLGLQEAGQRTLAIPTSLLHTAMAAPIIGPSALALPFVLPRLSGAGNALGNYIGSAIGKHIPVPGLTEDIGKAAPEIAEGLTQEIPKIGSVLKTDIEKRANVKLAQLVESVNANNQ